MVAVNRKRIRCVVIAVPAEDAAWTARGALAQELVPGADPYVAQLIKRLQDEVRLERRKEALQRRERVLAAIDAGAQPAATKPRFEQHQLVGDLEIPWFDMPNDDDGDTGVPDLGDSNDDVAPAW